MNKRYVEIDYLRFLSMICVFLIHTYDKINISLIRTLISKLSLGNVVATFFVISGFLAFASEKEETTLEYYKNRFLRIYLVYWITFHVNLYIKCIWLKQLKFDCVRYFIGVCGLQMAIPSQDYSWNGLGASGSLSAFIVFYALVPIFRKIIKNEKQAWLLCGGGGICCYIIRYIMVYTLTEWGDSGRWLPFYSPQTNLWYFLIGIVLWFAKDHTNIKYILLEIIGCILALSIFRYDSYEFYAMCTALMLSVYWTLPRKELPHLKIIDKFNTIGYAFWLVHPIILVLIGKFSEKYTVKGYGYIDWLLILALSIVCAWLLTISVNKVVNNIRGKQL